MNVRIPIFNFQFSIPWSHQESSPKCDRSAASSVCLPLSKSSNSLGASRSYPPSIAILGVPFNNITMGGAIEAIEQMILSRHPHYLVTANVDFLVQAHEDVELRRILFDAHLVLCDGTPVVWASRLLGNPLCERVAGSDLVPLLIEVAARKRYRVFFLGATPESAAQAVARMQKMHPTLIVAGHYSPPFKKLLEMDHDQIKQRILEAAPDFLFVSFGCPKQEKWIAMHYRALGVPVCVGVGATIDFLAGQVKRAPLWMQRTGTDWVFRLGQEPRRLLRRYTKDLRVFAWLILAQWWQLQFRRRRKSAALTRPHAPAPEVVRAPERLDAAATLSLDQIPAVNCLLDLSGVQFIDSTGVGWLIGLQRRIQAASHQLILICPSLSVQRALALMRLQDFFTSAPDFLSAKRLIKTLPQEKPNPVTFGNAPSDSIILWHGEITAANAEDVWQQTSSRILKISQSLLPPISLVLSDVPFIDSTGLGLMIRIKKLANQQEMALLFTGLQPAVLNVIHLARLHPFLLAKQQN
jgi:N-acetylglucosaminyldiphosphoundecaprenol N-acetyl-beta-D-mannosaminyltransferase